MDRTTLLRVLRMAILAALVLLPFTAGVLLVMLVGKAILPLAVVGSMAMAVYLILRGPLIMRSRSGKE